MILKLTSAAPDATTLTLLDDGATATGYDLLLGSSFGAPAWDHTFSGQRGTQGARASKGSLPNREVALILRITGATKDAVAAKMSDLAEAVDDVRRYGGTLRWRSRSQTRYQNADVLTATIGEPSWDNRLEQINRAVIAVRLVCGPYMLWDPLDFTDDFSVDNVNAGELAYTADAGALTNLVVSGGVLTAAANLATEDRFIHTGTGYTIGDHEAQIAFVPGATITSLKGGVVLKRIDASNYLEAYADDNGVNSRLRIDKVVAGVRTNLASTNLASRMAVSQRTTVRGRIEENTVYAEHSFGGELQFAVTGFTSTSITLTTAESAVFGIGVSGRSGFVFTPQHAAAFVERFSVLPFTYRQNNGGASKLASVLHARGTIPGDAPAACDVWMANKNATAIYFGMIGWAPTSNFNVLQNGGFEAIASAPTAWSVAAVAGVTGAATSIALDGNSPRYGFSAGLVTTPATANVGTTYAIYRRFLKGVTYTARAWVRANTATTAVRIRLGVSGDIASSTAVALSTTWTLHTITWTPAANVSLAYLAVEQTAATASQFMVDGAAVYEGTVAPTHGGHVRGNGGHPPLAVIAGADNISATAALGVAADANAKSGYVLRDTSVLAGGESYDVYWNIDPSLVGPDDYSGDEISVEVWGRFYLHTAFTGGHTFTLSLVDQSSSPISYTAEYGSTGKVVPATAVTGYKMLRLGTLTMSTTGAALWRLLLHSTVAAGTNLQQFGIDCLFLAPARAFASTPSGKTNTGYPAIFPSGVEQTKIIRSEDLSGSTIAAPTDAIQNRSSGMGGAPIELPPGAVDLLAFVTQNPVEIPGGGGGSDGTADQPPVHLSVTPRSHWLRDA